MKMYMKVAAIAVIGLVLPVCSFAAAGWAEDIKSLNSVLDQLYDEMIPKCDQLIGVGRGLAGFGALWYIAARVWRHLANAEPIDFYPLLRPFGLGLCIILFPALIAVFNGVLSPTVTGTSAMVTNSDKAVETLLAEKAEAVKHSDFYEMYVGADGEGNRDKWYKYAHNGQDPSEEGVFEGIGNDVKFFLSKASYNFRNAIKTVISEVLQVLFAAVALTINTLRTFNLIILAIIGPFVFGFSVFDGFGHSLRHWIARYINVYLWLPVANIFGSVIGNIQENMLKLDIAQINQTGDTFFSRTDAGYLVFMIIAIYGYTTVPSIAGYIIHVGGHDPHTVKITNLATNISTSTKNAITGGVGSSAEAIANSGGYIKQGYNQTSTGQGLGASLGRAYGQATGYLKNKLTGK